MFKQRERDKKLQRPKRWFLNFRLDPRRQGGADLDGFPNTSRHFCEVLKSALGSLRIHNVRAKESATAIEFEVEIAAVRLGLSEEFHATVFPDFIHIIRPHAAHVTVLDLKNTVNAFGV